MSTNQPLTVRVVREIAGGLIVTLPDGREGLIREREWSWDNEERAGGARRFKPGDVTQAVLLNRGAGQRPELSIRLAEADPWVHAERRYPVGSLAEGIVTGIMPYGAFVELELGITGLLHLSRLPQWAEGDLSDLFWPGDPVKVVIDRVEVKAQRISLRMSDLSSQRWRDAPRDTRRAGAPAATNIDEPLRSRLDALFARPPRKVLVVEDDPKQQAALIDWLRRAGQVAEAASRVAEAITLMESLRPDIVLMDVGLPEVNGVDGMRRVVARRPEARCVLMTDWDRAAHHAADIQALRETGVALLIKPLRPEDLLGILLEKPSSAVVAQGELPILPAKLPPRSRLAAARKDELSGTLSRLLNATHADKVILFEVDTDSRQVTIYDQKGPAAMRPSAVAELIHSPVRDVAEDGQIVMARGPQEAESGRFRHLTPLITFSGCVGAPVPARLRKRYALFLFFGGQPDGRLESSVARAEGTAEVIGAWLERQQFNRQMADLQRLALLGQMKRMLAHEVSGKLQTINLELDRLENNCYNMKLQATSSPPLVVEEADKALATIKTLKGEADMIARTTQAFSQMKQMRQEDLVILEIFISDSLVMLDDLAEESHVTLEALPYDQLTFTRTNVTFLQQALVNVLQNAIQHISQLRPVEGGRVAIRLAKAEQGGRPVLQLRVEDDGPGIHRRNWERIFELDFTTRSEGSGLGLFLSRNLVESQGGRLCVESSYMLWGTTFLIELPIQT